MQGKKTTSKTRLKRVCGGLLAGMLALSMAFSTAQARNSPAPGEDITNLVTPLDDLQAALSVSKFDTKELDKIGKDFGMVYRLKNLTLFFKSPDKVRMEGNSRVFGDGLLICNGPSIFYTVPKINIRRTENIADAPTRRLSLLEWGGILSKDTLRFMQGEFVKRDTLDETPVAVYDLRYKGLPNGQRYRVWLDTKTRITLKREWYDAKNQLRATFFYSAPQEIAAGVWLPTQCEIKNSEGGTGAVMSFKDARINQGLDDALFEIKP